MLGIRREISKEAKEAKKAENGPQNGNLRGPKTLKDAYPFQAARQRSGRVATAPKSVDSCFIHHCNSG